MRTDTEVLAIAERTVLTSKLRISFEALYIKCLRVFKNVRVMVYRLPVENHFVACLQLLALNFNILHDSAAHLNKCGVIAQGFFYGKGHQRWIINQFL